MKAGQLAVTILFVGCGGRLTASDVPQDRDAGSVQPPVPDATMTGKTLPDAAVDANEVVVVVDAVAPCTARDAGPYPGPGCHSPGEKCGSNRDCCSMVCTADYGCVGYPGLCPLTGSHCSSSSECCSRNCVDGICHQALDICAAIGAPCERDSTCCGGHCDPGTLRCAGTPASCLPAGAPCTSALGCCSARCVDCICQNPAACRDPGETCGPDSDCCRSACVDSHCTCVVDHDPCRSDSDCCGGSCDRQTFRCRSQWDDVSPCKPTGHLCGASTECCSLSCTGGVCE